MTATDRRLSARRDRVTGDVVEALSQQDEQLGCRSSSCLVPTVDGGVPVTMAVRIFGPAL
jgi:hypothetical protein